MISIIIRSRPPKKAESVCGITSGRSISRNDAQGTFVLFLDEKADYVHVPVDVVFDGFCLITIWDLFTVLDPVRQLVVRQRAYRKRRSCSTIMTESLASSDVRCELRMQGKSCRVDRYSINGSGRRWAVAKCAKTAGHFGPLQIMFRPLPAASRSSLRRDCARP
jgi:hypothetical protein